MITENDAAHREAPSSPRPVLDQIANRTIRVQPGLEALHVVVADHVAGAPDAINSSIDRLEILGIRLSAVSSPCRHQNGNAGNGRDNSGKRTH